MRPDIEKSLSAKINKFPDLKRIVKAWQKAGNKVVFTNGVFDLLHVGHVTYLSKAAELGDKLVVGLNSDDSVRRIKGPSRPINNETNRATLLAALFFIDAVIIFERDTPIELIIGLMPDVLVKGADYSVKNIVGAQEVIAHGGEVKTVPFVEGHSSTSIIQKIQG